MKRNLFFASAIGALCVSLLLTAPGGRTGGADAETGISPVQGRDDELRGLWVSTVYRLDYPLQYTSSAEELGRYAEEIVNDAADTGYNAIFFQVRPTGDAMYDSDIFPWSKYLTGTQGKAPEGGFDPLSCFAEKAHAAGIELHAWINPYRITMSESDELSADNPALLRPELTEKYGGKLYYNPGNPEARALILDGAEEILENYDVDGLHIDDYFYPGTDFPDEEEYARYGQGMSLGDWRRANNDALVRALGELAEEYGVPFGVSPAGIWKNASSDPAGSDTNGYETYFSAYADTRGWVKKEYVDYILPQIYWKIGNRAADYEILVKWWKEVCEGTSVRLYIGQAIYQVREAGWETEEIGRQINLARTEGADGYVHFRYEYLSDVKELVSEFNAAADSSERKILLSAENAQISAPESAEEGTEISVTVTAEAGKFLRFAEIDGTRFDFPDGHVRELTFRALVRPSAKDLYISAGTY